MQLPGNINKTGKVSKAQSVLEKYLPQNSLELVMQLLRTEPVQLKITKPRKTKFGDYRFPDKQGRHRISLNANLNQYAFLITLIHEMAHLKAFKDFGKRIKPHGTEWQKTFIELAKPFIKAGIFPPELEKALIKSLNKGSASSCTDLELFKMLKQFDPDLHKKIHLEDLEAGAVFSLGKDKIFKKGPKLRKRFKCLNLTNGREYMVHPLAEIRLINPDKNKKSA